MKELAGIDILQRQLSVFQAIPVVGPLAVSPVKSLISVAQAIVGLSLVVLGTFMAITDIQWRFPVKVIELGAHHFLAGFISFSYASFNMATLGLGGLCCEVLIKAVSQR